MADPKPKKAKKAAAPPAAEKLVDLGAPSADSKEARDERKAAAHTAYHANPPEESRAARKARSPQE
jgi:hypothetical protein